MPKYLIEWNAGYGYNRDVVEASHIDEAQEIAYREWKDEAESNAEYAAQPLTQEIADEHGFEYEVDK